MKVLGYIFSFLFIALCPTFCFAQDKVKSEDQLTFDKEILDVGNIKLKDGELEYSFKYVNKTKKMMAILNVVSNCGCTKPSWDTAPIRPGDKGVVKVVFKNNQGLGIFDKKLTVRTTTFATPVTLRLRGNVTE